MPALGITQLLAQVTANVYQNASKDVTGQILQDQLVDTIDSLSQSLYNPSIPYNAGQSIDFNNGTDYKRYVCLSNTVAGESPSTTPAKWIVVNGVLNELYQPDGTNPFVYTDNSGALHIDGDIIQTGATYETHAEQLYTTKDMVITRDGAVAGLGVGEYTGFQATLYDGVNNGQLVFDKDGWAWVGDVGSLSKLATIQDTSDDEGIAFYDLATFKLITNSNFIFDGTNLGVGVTSPAAKLEVNGSIRTSIGAGGELTLFDDGTGGFNNRLIAGANATGSYVYGTQGGAGDATLSLNALGGGNVAIGQTSAAEKLEVNGNVKADDFIIV